MEIVMLFIGISVFLIGFLILIFRENIGNIYNVMKLSESEKEYYKKIVLRRLGLLLLILGIIITAIYFIPVDNFRLSLVSITEGKQLILQILGIVLICYGLFSIIVRIMKKEEKFYKKLEPMKRQYGSIKGTIVHIIGYTIAPIVLGLFLIFKDLLSTI